MAAMTAYERQQIQEIRETIMENSQRLARAESQLEGFVDMRERQIKIENKVSGILKISIGIAVGIGLTAIAFGYLSIKQFVELLK